MNLLQAARVDGCSELRLWWEIALPVVRPMIGAFTLMSFLAAWNSFLWPSIMLQDQGKYTLPMGLANMAAMNEYQTHYGVLMAGTMLERAAGDGVVLCDAEGFYRGADERRGEGVNQTNVFSVALGLCGSAFTPKRVRF